MHITAAFDAGNIELLELTGPNHAKLAIRKDAESDFLQWFSMRASGVRGQECEFCITNAHEAAYLDGWNEYRAVASYDRENWFRVPTSYEQGELTIRMKPTQDSVWLAYFAPYSMERHQDLIAKCQMSPRTHLKVLGSTLDGQDLDLLEIGANAPGARHAWIIARQHPGETMAEWWMEGFLERLLDGDDPVARALFGKLTFHVVPNMNPDGSRRGHLRTNACGANLNREWLEPTMERSPEVRLVRNHMDKTGVDFFFDVHGDEGLPYNFIAGPEGIPSITDLQMSLLSRFQSALVQANPDFQTEHGYPSCPPGKANLTMATSQVAERFGCLGMTLEMPFKDNANAPSLEHGWSPERCRKLGASSLDALYVIVNDLRG